MHAKRPHDNETRNQRRRRGREMRNDDSTLPERCACANERTADRRQKKPACKTHRTVIAVCTQTRLIACTEKHYNERPPRACNPQCTTTVEARRCRRKCRTLDQDNDRHDDTQSMRSKKQNDNSIPTSRKLRKQDSRQPPIQTPRLILKQEANIETNTESNSCRDAHRYNL